MKTQTDKRIEELQRQVLELTALAQQAGELISALSRQTRDATDAAVTTWMQRRNSLFGKGART